MRATLVLLLMMVSYAPHVLASQSSPTNCNVVEAAKNNEKYNQLLCAGVVALQHDKYQEAVHDFESAMNVRLLEYPNFALYPRLALAYYKAGDEKKAGENLKKAELSLSVLVGIFHCQETESGFYIARGTSIKVDSPFNYEIATRMCGDAYDYVYRPESLEEVLADERLVANYFEIKKMIAKE